ncbi:MAG: glycosyltransferase family 2 protein [Flavobacteriales bacterium]|nr:glycosyltransferase family 2 protein [Flavobacteriales bacterium]MCB9449024.1 glycosyltransferase family 2 protein [Flavobacteriales bacterium]
MDQIAIVILNWNGCGLLSRFVPGIVAHSDGARVVVVDNGSTDDSVAWLSQHHPSVEVIRHKQNLGFTGGYNEALKHVQAKYYVILNSDVEVTPGWLQPMLEWMETEDRLGAIQPKLLAEKQRHLFEYAGAGGGFIDKYGFPFCRGRLFQDIEEDHGQFNDRREVFWASGACMFIRSEAFHAAGGFDSDFFAHMEEIDLCWRLKRMGYAIGYCGSSTVYHMGGATLITGSPRKTYLNFRNNLCMLFKNLPEKKFARTLIIKMVLDGIASIRFLLEGHGLSSLAVLKAHLYMYGHMRMLRSKRNELKRQASVSEVSNVYGKSIVWTHYVMRKHRFDELEAGRFRAPAEEISLSY